jgi:hypothetical protein
MTARDSSPSHLVTDPTAPLISANSMARPSREVRHRLAGDRLRPADVARPSGRTEVGSQHRVRVEYGDQSVEVPVSPGCGEGLDDLALSLRIGVGDGVLGSARTRRRVRLASWRAASGERSTIRAISSKGTANMSCSTNASRSAGLSVSSTTSRATPAEPANSASCSGSVPSDHRRQPPAAVLDHVGVRATEPQPALLERVVGLARRAEHPMGDRAQAVAILFEAPGQLVLC